MRLSLMGMERARRKWDESAQADVRVLRWRHAPHCQLSQAAEPDTAARSAAARFMAALESMGLAAVTTRDGRAVRVGTGVSAGLDRLSALIEAAARRGGAGW